MMNTILRSKMNKETDWQTEVIQGCREKYLNAILNLQPFFPIEIQDNEEKIVKNLSEPLNINIFLKKGERVVGYVLATPHNDALRELRDDDIELREDADRYYFDKITVVPEYRKGFVFLKLVYAIIEEANRRGFYKFSSHVLSNNGLNRVLVRIFGKMLTERRNVFLALDGNAPFEYMEMTYIIKK